MHHIAICDDEPVIRKQLRTMLTGHPLAGELVLSEFDSGEALLETLRAGRRYLLVILDIEMKTVSGVEVGRALRRELGDNHTQILYISAHQHYAMELFEVRPLHFLVKPVAADKLLRCVDDALALYRPEEAVFTCMVGKEVRRIPLRDIRYFESYGKKLIIHTVHERVECRQKLADILPSLPKSDFYQIHQSFVVQFRYTQRINHDRLTLDNGEELSVSQTYRKEVKELLFMQFPTGG